MYCDHYIHPLFFLTFYFLFYYILRQGLTLCSSGCPETYHVDQAGLKLRDAPTSACLSISPNGLAFSNCTSDSLILYSKSVNQIGSHF